MIDRNQEMARLYVEEGLRDYAAARDADLGHASGLTDTMRDAAAEIARLREYEKHWRELGIKTGFLHEEKVAAELARLQRQVDTYADLIPKQQAEIERLQAVLAEIRGVCSAYSDEYSGGLLLIKDLAACALEQRP